MEIDSGGKFDEIFDVEEEELNFVVCLWLGGEIERSFRRDSSGIGKFQSF
jgi:hypothetical protein